MMKQIIKGAYGLILPSLLMACLSACGGGGSGSSDSGDSGSSDSGSTVGVTTPAKVCDVPTAWTVPSTGTVVGNGTAASCTFQALSTAVTNAGSITFNCGSNNVTIPVTSAIEVSGTATTVVDGGGKVTLDGGNTNRIFVVPNGGSLSVRNLTFINGNSEQTTTQIDRGLYAGGAVSAKYLAHLEVIDSVFENNAAGYGGGAVSAHTGTLTIVGSTFKNNHSLQGGAVYSLYSTLRIYNSEFTNNSTTAGRSTLADGTLRDHWGAGGAIATDGALMPDGELRLCGTVVKNNTGYGNGGGIYLWAYAPNSIIIDRTTIQGNTVGDNSSGNKGAGGGGRISVGGTDDAHADGQITTPGTILVTRSSILSNTATGNGGGFYVDCYGPCEFNNSTFYGNTTTGGVGAAIQSAGPSDTEAYLSTRGDFRNVTFAGNKGYMTLFGDRFHIYNTVFSTETDAHCSSTGTGSNVLQYRGSGTITPCIDGTILTGDPLLAAPADNGGPTETMLPGSASPLLNAGADCESTDQRGTSRDTSRCDIGAVEVP
jgi:hypothetical protein